LVSETSKPPFAVVSSAPGVVGKSAPLVKPATYALPAGSTATRWPLSTIAPPMQVEYVSAEPVVFSFVTKTSYCPRFVRLKAPAVVGKSAEIVSPVTKALPEALTAMPRGSS